MRRVIGVLAAIVLLTACSPKQAWKKKAIDDKEKSIMDEAKRGKIDTTGLKELLVAYDAYVSAYPNDTISANYLFKEADFYRYMRKPQKSIEIYSNIYNSYPKYFKRPYSLFLQGFIYENEMHNLDSARAKYEMFLQVFPNHPIAKDVKITLASLGKTPEQVIAEFEARQKADSTMAGMKDMK
jgi:tetratricopeptide (TPR) repeat protein